MELRIQDRTLERQEEVWRDQEIAEGTPQYAAEYQSGLCVRTPLRAKARTTRKDYREQRLTLRQGWEQCL